MVNLRTNKFNLIIEAYDYLNNKYIVISRIEDMFKTWDNVDKYYIIEHNKDIDDEGVFKRNHYHIVLVTYSPTTKKSIINSIAKELKVNISCISCQGVIDITSSMRYLTHKDNDNKYKYSDDDIIGNDPFYYDDIINYGDTSNMNVNGLYEIISNASNICEVYAVLGLKVSTKYRNIINDMWKCIKRSELK